MKTLKHKYWFWLVLAISIGGVIFIPLLFVLEGFFAPSGSAEQVKEQLSNIAHLKKYALPQMIYTTLRMIVGVGFVSILLGVMPAYFIANFKFPLRNFLKRANIFPLTIPTYIMGFVYASIFSVTGTFTKIAQYFFTLEDIFSWNINVVTEGWLIVFLGFALYPYVYSACLLHFSKESIVFDEAAATLGANYLKRFFKVILPLAIPTILGSVSLVAMEVLNDYGAMSYFNVKTFTAGIFQAKQMHFSGSLYLSALLFVTVGFLFTSVYFIRTIKKVQTSTQLEKSVKEVKKRSQFVLLVITAFPFIVGFVVPVLQLIYLAIGKYHLFFSSGFMSLFVGALEIALITAVLILFCSLILHYNSYLNKGVLANVVSNITTLGYAIPGAVIGVAVIGFVYVLDSSGNIYKFGVNSLFLLVFGYCIRFFAVGYNTLEANFNQISNSLPDASRLLGFGALKTFFAIHLPLLRSGIYTTLAIVAIDVLKELPLTLILQPFNFETLATKAYKKAKVAESVADASPYALVLIFCGLLVTLILMRTKTKTYAQH